MQSANSLASGYRFGVFEVNVRSGEIRKNGLRIKLQDQPFRVLTILLESHPNPVTREEIRKLLWGEDTFVEFDHGLSNAISRIREALGDPADNARFIETLPRRGYRFIAPAEPIISADAASISANGTNGNAAAVFAASWEVNKDSEPVRPSPVSRWRQPALLALVISALAIAALIGWHRETPPAAPVTRATILLPPGLQLASLGQPALALSPDGLELAYVAAPVTGGQPQIYLRRMDGVDAVPLQGTEGAADPFFSPDNQWLAFFADGKLKKMSVNGGVPQILRDVVNPSGGSWGSDDSIIFAPYSSVLQRATDNNGAPTALSRFEVGETFHIWPDLLPERKVVLFTAVTKGPGAIVIQQLGTGERKTLLQGQELGMARYVSSGHLIYAQAGNIMAVPLDGRHLEIKGQPIPVVQGVMQSLGSGAAQYSVSGTGSLAYVSGDPLQIPPSTLVWVDRNGKEEAIAAPPRAYNQPRLSPSGTRVAVDVIGSTENMQVWLYDLPRDTLAPFTFEGVNRHAVWTPDGKRIAFMSNRDGASEIFWKLADGSGEVEPLTSSAPVSDLDIPYSWTPDGQSLAFVKIAPTTNAEFWVLHLKDRTTERFLRTQALYDGAPQFSPDGHWVAYTSEETGRREIFVQGYPGLDGKWQVSTDGGNEPVWNRNGRELFYRNGEQMMAVDINTAGGFAPGKPHALFSGHYIPTVVAYARANYDVSSDGRKFLMLKATNDVRAGPTQINVVLNWSEELKQKVPIAK